MRSVGFALLAVLVLWTGYATTEMLKWRRRSRQSDERATELERQAKALMQQTQDLDRQAKECLQIAKDAVTDAKAAIAELKEYKRREGREEHPS